MRRYTWSDLWLVNDSIYCKIYNSDFHSNSWRRSGRITVLLGYLVLGLVPLLLTFGCKKLLDKNVNINWIMVGIFVLSLLMAAVHIV